jgi:hypothetical protein
VMAVSAKLAGGLSSQNADQDEIKVSLEFLGMAYNHLGIAVFLLRNLLLERAKTPEDEQFKRVFASFLNDASPLEAGLREHMLRLRDQHGF